MEFFVKILFVKFLFNFNDIQKFYFSRLQDTTKARCALDGWEGGVDSIKDRPLKPIICHRVEGHTSCVRVLIVYFYSYKST